jgi:hypothetical protein
MSEYIAVSVGKPASNAGVGANKKDMVTLINLDDVATCPERDGKGVRIADNIVMKADKYAIKVYGTVTTMEGGITTDGEVDSRGFNHNFKFSHPGSSVEAREFATAWNNKRIIAIVEKCSGGGKTMYGSCCAPLQMNLTGTDNSSENKLEFEFASVVKTELLPAEYEGTITYETPLGSSTADSATLNVAAGSGQYQLVDNTTATALTGLINPVHGAVYTLLGSGGDDPYTIATGGNFLLKDGTGWTAATGTQITFRAFKDGASTYKFVELSRA